MGTHLTPADRGAIEALLRENHSIRHIASALGKSPSSISREIGKHAKTIKPRCCDCLNFRVCVRHKICNPAAYCNKACRNCVQARKYCPGYVKAYCDALAAIPSGICNSCEKKSRCHYDHKVYKASSAQREADDSLRCSRIDLRDAVKRKPRKKTAPNGYKIISAIKGGHKYGDFLDYVAEHDVPVVQMDCVEGRKEDEAVLLTLHFTAAHLQIALILDSHTSSSVVAGLDKLEETLGKGLFSVCFPLNLTDNGHEFSDISGMERSIYGGPRTKVFFCEPNRSDEKGACENNHKYIRYVVPKGSSLEPLDQFAVNLMMNHVNSYARKSLHGNTPYKIGRLLLPGDFFDLLGIEEIPADEINLTPSLLNFLWEGRANAIPIL